MNRRIGHSRAGINHQQNNKYADIGLLTIRVGVAAFMLFAHGADKLVNFSAKVSHFPDPLGFGGAASLILAIFAEFFCSLAVGFGFLTRLATVPLIITMLIAAFVVHGAEPWAKQELALVYFLAYLAILIAGPGKYSIDRMFFRKNGDS